MLPPLERLAALSQAYDVPLASLLVSHDALIPLMTMLEQASAAQLSAFVHLLHQALDQAADNEIG